MNTQTGLTMNKTLRTEVNEQSLEPNNREVVMISDDHSVKCEGKQSIGQHNTWLCDDEVFTETSKTVNSDDKVLMKKGYTVNCNHKQLPEIGYLVDFDDLQAKKRGYFVNSGGN